VRGGFLLKEQLKQPKLCKKVICVNGALFTVVLQSFHITKNKVLFMGGSKLNISGKIRVMTS